MIDFVVFLLNFIILFLFAYMFFRLLGVLHKNNYLNDDDMFFITSSPFEFKYFKEKKKNIKDDEFKNNN